MVLALPTLRATVQEIGQRGNGNPPRRQILRRELRGSSRSVQGPKRTRLPDGQILQEGQLRIHHRNEAQGRRNTEGAGLRARRPRRSGRNPTRKSARQGRRASQVERKRQGNSTGGALPTARRPRRLVGRLPLLRVRAQERDLRGERTALRGEGRGPARVAGAAVQVPSLPDGTRARRRRRAPGELRRRDEGPVAPGRAGERPRPVQALVVVADVHVRRRRDRVHLRAVAAVSRRERRGGGVQSAQRPDPDEARLGDVAQLYRALLPVRRLSNEFSIHVRHVRARRMPSALGESVAVGAGVARVAAVVVGDP
mmetsp:Transcript_38970/g.83167  ORF Transcript_38970/g.83167 Transcript_38970/m.83167 type:complete len:312 (-) Transcript_38970:154-1089(-)